MAVVTGDRYLERLVRFVDRNAEPLLEGSLTLKLNPVGLHYVQSRLEALKELEGLLVGAPVDYFRAYVSDLGDHRALEQLRRILRLLTSLKVISVLPPPDKDPTPLSLMPFGRLKVLELRGCDLSTSEPRGLLELRHTLEKLICHNSTDALRHVFVSRIVDIKESPVWKRLSFVSCACNGLVLMDESLQLLPAVETLDLSRNKFAKAGNLRKCSKLQHLDLGFNHLRTVTSLNEVMCPIVKLVLRNNALTTLHGIENLKLIEGLDLSYNIISNFSELEILTNLSSLKDLWLEGNPICCARWYRAHVFSIFRQPDKLKLDEKEMCTREYWEMQAILASRQKRPAGYGFYFPAKDDNGAESSTNTKKKKHSRLACINEEGRKFLVADALDQESVSCDSDHLKKDENVISDSEAEIADLINRVEAMKKERSVLWLREFSEWLENTSDETLNGKRSAALNVDHGSEMYTSRGKDGKHIGESSIYAMNSAEVSKVENSMSVSKSEISATDAFKYTHGDKYSESNGKSISGSSLVVYRPALKSELGIGAVGFKQSEQDPCSTEPSHLSSLEKMQSFPDTLTANMQDHTEQNIQLEPSTDFEEIMGSRASSTYPVSPPHYKEDILQRRQNLEEEFFHVSAESYSIASSDSDTSCSDDDSYRLSTCFSGHNLLDETFTNESVSDDSSEIEENCHDERQDDPILRVDGGSSPTTCSEIPSCELPKSVSLKPFPTNTMVKYFDKIVDEDDVSLDKNGRWKPKKAVVSIPDMNIVSSRDPLPQKSNGAL